MLECRAVAPEPDPPEVLERFDANRDLVQILARQVYRTVGPQIELNDLVSYGHKGLLDASRRFDARRGVPFRAYANYRVRGAIVDGLRSSGSLPRRVYSRLAGLRAATRVSEGALEDMSVPVAPGTTPADAERALGEHLAAMATAMAIGLLGPTARDEAGNLTTVAREDPEHSVAQAELLHLVRAAVDELPEQEAELVRRHYFEGERFDQVARDLGLSKSWASRLHTRAIGRLTRRLRQRR